MKNNRILNNIKYIPYDNSFSLIDFAENYVHTLDEKVFELQTVEGNIEIVFQKIPYMYVIKSWLEMVDYCSYSKIESIIKKKI